MDPLFPTPSIQAVSHSFFKKKQWSAEVTDTKVKGYFLEKIGEGPRGALLPTAAAPRVMLDLLSAFTFPTPPPVSRRKRQLRVRRGPRNRAPVGLRKSRPEWINAWMQFLLFLPSVPELFPFLPRSFAPFREFAEQYAWDQYEDRAVSVANSATLIRCLRQALPVVSGLDLYELLCLFVQTAFPHCLSNAVLFHPEWHLILDEKDLAFHKKIKKVVPELLIAVRGKDHRFFLKKQITNGCLYDLDAFVERRPDGQYEPSFITYLKVEGTWYQCEDERVAPILSTHLNIPLRNATLLHYQKLSFP